MRKTNAIILTVLCLSVFTNIISCKENPHKETTIHNTTKIAVVSGANRGIGLAIVEQLIKEKVKVIAIARNTESLLFLLQQFPNQIEIIKADLSTEQGQKSILDQFKESKIDYLVHNAAIIQPIGTNSFLDASPEDLRKIIETNLISPIILTNLLGSKLKEGTRVLNVSSRAGEKAYSGLGAYCTTKAGLDMYTESLQLDRPHGILAASVHPGEVDTGMQSNLRDNKSPDFPFSKFFIKNYHEKKLISPELSGKYIVWLLLKTSDQQFTQQKHNIYDTSHHMHWDSKDLTNPY